MPYDGGGWCGRTPRLRPASDILFHFFAGIVKKFKHNKRGNILLTHMMCIDCEPYSSRQSEQLLWRNAWGQQLGLYFFFWHWGLPLCLRSPECAHRHACRLRQGLHQNSSQITFFEDKIHEIMGLPSIRGCLDFWETWSPSPSLFSSTVSTEGDLGRLDDADADADGASGGGVISGEGLAAAASRTALATRIALRSASAVRAATRWEEVSGLATLLGSAKSGAAFKTRPLRDDATGLADDIGEVTNEVMFYFRDWYPEGSWRLPEGVKNRVKNIWDVLYWYYTVDFSHPKPRPKPRLPALEITSLSREPP
jgi:hypothetical protein